MPKKPVLFSWIFFKKIVKTFEVLHHGLCEVDVVPVPGHPQHWQLGAVLELPLPPAHDGVLAQDELLLWGKKSKHYLTHIISFLKSAILLLTSSNMVENLIRSIG